MSLALVRQKAFNLLAKRDYAQQELASKLHSSRYSPHDIAIVIAELVEKKYLDDRRFTENYIHKRRRKGYGPHRIRHELQALGIGEELIAETLKITDNAWFTDAHQVWHKHFKGQFARDFKTRAKHIRFLQYRGFTTEQIEHVLDD